MLVSIANIAALASKLFVGTPARCMENWLHSSVSCLRSVFRACKFLQACVWLSMIFKMSLTSSCAPVITRELLLLKLALLLLQPLLVLMLLVMVEAALLMNAVLASPI